MKDRNLAETAEVAEQIAIPLLEAAQGEPREEMQELWAIPPKVHILKRA